MSQIVRGGVRIRYEDIGTGTPVLLTHGFGASVEMWAGQVSAFADRFRFICWDMRGHGESDAPAQAACYSQAETVADMTAILDHLGIDQAVIGGHSLGGFMSLAFNVAHTSRVKALILQGCGPGYRSDTARHTWNERAENRAQTLERGGLDALGGGAEVTVSKQGTAQGLAHAARGILSQIDASVIDSLPGIGVPTLVVIGDGDTPYLTGSKYMSDRIPGVRSVVVPGAGHGVNVEKPEVVNPLFEQFLSAL
ncbi:MAG: pimeloyl-ACP methyl ester carboxylesterase [Gammaproteobacteria bacterium]|jgi:pimeloyl-ACP methyl ester carboxylesterase